MGLTDITDQIRVLFNQYFSKIISVYPCGILHFHIPHTSCAITMSEAFDPSAKKDLESFMDHIAPQNLPFITHTAEGPDDSPSHMKSIIVGENRFVFIDAGQLLLGTWQGIYLCEFRSSPKKRKIHMKYAPDAFNI
ncbi:MAG: YjbQ family protein [Bacteriovoracaceae bacterium]|nr:YjbQ family protein [Bacteriovoracaceae bacterium]